MDASVDRAPVIEALCCPPLGEATRLTPDEASVMADLLAALADPARISIVSILAGRPDHALTTRELAPMVALGEATVSHHLKRLAEAGIVGKRRDGAKVYYSLNLAAVRAVATVLDVNCDCC